MATPVALSTVAITLTAAAFSVAYTVTPLPALTYLFAFASPQRSAGRNFEGDFRLILVSCRRGRQSHGANHCLHGQVRSPGRRQ